MLLKFNANNILKVFMKIVCLLILIIIKVICRQQEMFFFSVDKWVFNKNYYIIILFLRKKVILRILENFLTTYLNFCLKMFTQP